MGIPIYFKMDTKKCKRDRLRYLSKKRMKMMNLRRKIGQPQEERMIRDINPVEIESTSQLPDVVEYLRWLDLGLKIFIYINYIT